MHIHRPLHTLKSVCRFRVFFLAFVWIAGLSLGGYAALCNVKYSYSFTLVQPHFFQVLLLSLLPLLLSAIALCICFWILYPIVFIKAITFGFTSVLLVTSYGHSGWLIRVLVMFPGIISLFITWFFWLTQAAQHPRSARQLMIFATLGIVAVALLDVYILIPALKQSALFL
ncbi:MAG: hypothetical protein IJB47_02100 [Oscillospiraceae bacterium]|nr:hypothetical protein [Oscillospiraceae bacterium]